MHTDPLSPLLTHFNARAKTFFTGNPRARANFPEKTGVGYLHLFRGGMAQLHDRSGDALVMRESMLVFYARSLTH